MQRVMTLWVHGHTPHMQLLLGFEFSMQTTLTITSVLKGDVMGIYTQLAECV